jgi:hypothetical protein
VIPNFSRLRACFSLVLLATLFSRSASAYLDPGTGGAVVGSIGPIVGGFLALLGVAVANYLINPLKKLLSRVRGWFKGGKKKG